MTTKVSQLKSLIQFPATMEPPGHQGEAQTRRGEVRSLMRGRGFLITPGHHLTPMATSTQMIQL